MLWDSNWNKEKDYNRTSLLTVKVSEEMTVSSHYFSPVKLFNYSSILGTTTIEKHDVS